MSIRKVKSALRKAMLKEREALDPAVKAKMDQELTEKLIAFIRMHPTSVIHSYISMGNEINLIPFLNYLLASGITVVTPRSLPNRKMENLKLHSLTELETGIYGTSHPAGGEVYEGSYDIILVPGLAFDKKGFRLGYGAGYYDIFLATQPSAIKLGVCYPFQIVDEVPVEPHDVRLDKIIF